MGVKAMDATVHTERAAAAIDPVCGMQVDPARAPACLEHSGETVFFCSEHCRAKFAAAPEAYRARARGAHAQAAAAPPNPARKEMAKDPVCGMMVAKATALRTERGGRTYYFCSPQCRRTFADPERELKSMRTRVTIALTGVLALAILRAGAFLALAAGATIVTWAPIPALPWFTWGMWLFLLVTPVP